MLNREAFISYVLDGAPKGRSAEAMAGPALPGAFAGFGFEEAPADAAPQGFASGLLTRLFGEAKHLARAEVIRSDNPAAKFLSERVLHWPKAITGHFQVLLFELDTAGLSLLDDPFFRQERKEQRLEDALDRLIQTAQLGFAKGREAAVEQGEPDETLLVIAIPDDRIAGQDPAPLVDFGTVASEIGSFESFHLRGLVQGWERALSEDHLGQFYDRHLARLSGERWQDAFITGKERELARKLLDGCASPTRTPKVIGEAVAMLMREIGRSFGRGYQNDRLQIEELPDGHFIGVDPSAALKPRFKNPFTGLMVRGDSERLLGYVVYCLDEKRDAESLRAVLAANNAFHNVLVIYPDGQETTLELWQGKRPLREKLTKDGAVLKGEGRVVNLLSRFFVVSQSEVGSPSDLALALAERARYLRQLALEELEKERKLPKDEKRPVLELYETFDMALARQTDAEFADAYAQTLTYGLLAARWMSRSAGKRFTAAHVQELLPSTSPFLSDLFGQLISLRLASRPLGWLIEDLVSLLHRTAVARVFEDNARDPVIHFYEDFLDAYDPQIRKNRGVYYTPDEVVSYTVETVDDVLRTRIGLPLGLADTTTWADFAKSHCIEVPDGINPAEPFIQILDPALGTGTFLLRVFEVIYDTMQAHYKEMGLDEASARIKWISYVREHLLSRFYGFELMMAPYIVSHLRLGLALQESGFTFEKNDRLHVHLTNTLQGPLNEARPKLEGVSSALAREADAVDVIKRHRLFTVVIGNPPYSPSISNERWILESLDDWKTGLNETKIDLNREEWKFTRFAQILADRVPAFVWGYVINRDFLDGIAKRRMRESLQETFTSRRVIDLNGDVKGNVSDENVFNIAQGVCIVVGSKQIESHQQEHLFVSLKGTRIHKLSLLGARTRLDETLKSFVPSPPYYRWTPFQGEAMESAETEYRSWMPINEVFEVYSSGIQTKRDGLCVQLDRDEMWNTIQRFNELEVEQARAEFNLGKDGRDWTVEAAKRDIAASGPSPQHIIPILYRPFDIRFTYWTGKTKGFLAYPRRDVMQHVVGGDNLGLIFNRQIVGNSVSHFAVANITNCHGTFYLGNKGQDYFAPLWVIKSDLFTGGRTQRSSNLTPAFVSRLSTKLGKELSPEDVFNYIVGIFHSSGYRERYAELLKMDFPRVPLTANVALYQKIAQLGGKLIPLFLMQSTVEPTPITSEFSDKQPTIERVTYDEDMETVWIDKGTEFGFSGVTPEVWSFQVGGYQVCEKWLKNRKGRRLSREEIDWFRRVVPTLSEIQRVMNCIDEAIISQGGWPDAFGTASEEAS